MSEGDWMQVLGDVIPDRLGNKGKYTCIRFETIIPDESKGLSQVQKDTDLVP